jgi:Na+-transporting methylmalonyl-CoA/oxaloacetate decarboxylase gamma subunit
MSVVFIFLIILVLAMKLLAKTSRKTEMAPAVSAVYTEAAPAAAVHQPAAEAVKDYSEIAAVLAAVKARINS